MAGDAVTFGAHSLAQVQVALTSLRALVAPEPVDKTVWSSPAGKRRIAKRLAALLPAHRTYVEPFAGSGAVFFAKPTADVEVLNDFEPDIAKAYRLIQQADARMIGALRKKSWTGNKATFLSLYDSAPTSDVEWLYKFLYTAHFSYGRLRGRSFSPAADGVEATTVARIEAAAPRLRGVRVYSGDYERVVRKYDGKGTVMFLDPPYAGYDANVGEKRFDEDRFLKVLGDLKSKWLLTYGIRGTLPKRLVEAGYTVKRIRTPRTIRAMRGVGGSTMLTQILASNYEPASKSLSDAFGDGAVIEPWADDEVRESFATSGQILKAEERGEERYVLGVVLEPEVVDAQKDIYSVGEIRQAAHRFLEDFGTLGLMHQLPVTGQVKIVESYLAPQELTVGDVVVKAGTWLLAVHVLSDELWRQVKRGELTGFSIGGSARKVPEAGGGAA